MCDTYDQLVIKRNIIKQIYDSDLILESDLSNYNTFFSKINLLFFKSGFTFMYDIFYCNKIDVKNKSENESIDYIINLFTLKKFDKKYKFCKLRKIYNENIESELLEIVNSDNFNEKIIVFKKYLKNSFEDEVSKYYEKKYYINLDIFPKIYEKKNFEKFKKYKEYIQINNYLFRIIYTTYTEKYFTLLESINIDTFKISRFYIYKSISDIGTWKLAVSSFKKISHTLLTKPGDYLTGTFIHIDLQKYLSDYFNKEENIIQIDYEYNTLSSLLVLVNNNLKHGKKNILIIDEDKIIKEHINLLLKNKEIIQFGFFRTSEQISCLSFEFDKIRSFCYKINSLCGKYTSFSKDINNNPDINKIITKFITDNNLIKKINKTIEDFKKEEEFMHKYKYINYIIYSYLIEKFNIISNPIFNYEYNFEVNKKFIFKNISIYSIIIESKKNKQKYNYYYINYELNKIKYNVPYFIIPINRNICNFGVYNCYITGCFYFCKPIEYLLQINFNTNNEQHNFRIIDNDYVFIGDIVNNIILKSNNFYKNQLLSIYPII